MLDKNRSKVPLQVSEEQSCDFTTRLFLLQRKTFFHNEGCCDLALCCLDGLCGS